MSYSAAAQSEILQLLRQSPMTLDQLAQKSAFNKDFIFVNANSLNKQGMVKLTELTYSLTDEGRTLAEQFAGEWDAN
jgi:predicted transcriptional regulator